VVISAAQPIISRYCTSLSRHRYAEELDWSVEASELREWRRQVPIDLYVNGKTICTYTIDFVKVDRDSKVTYIEVKGWWGGD
jgi:hypothetical protein